MAQAWPGPGHSRCPACRARLDLSEPICPRCACDLSLAGRAQAQAQCHIALAAIAWADGHDSAARTEINAALGLHRSPLALAWRRLLNKPIPHPTAEPRP